MFAIAATSGGLRVGRPVAENRGAESRFNREKHKCGTWEPHQTPPPEGSIHLGALKGNVGDQTYELPPGTELAPGAYTALVWCEAFSVEFVGATVAV